MSGGVDIWLESFAAGSDPIAGLEQVFGIDASRARAIHDSIPRVVRRNATRTDAEEIAGALRRLGAKVELRPHQDPSASPRPAARASVAGPLAPRLSGLGLPVQSPPSPSPAAPAQPPPTSRSLDPLDPFTEGAPLELEFEPRAKKQPVAEPPSGAAHDAGLPLPDAPPEAPPPRATHASTPRGQHARGEAPAIEAAPPSALARAPLWMRVLGGFIGLSLLFWGGRCAYRWHEGSMPPSASELAERSAQRRAAVLAQAVALDVFLERPAAGLGRERGRNNAFVDRLRRAGAPRLLVTDIADVPSGDVAFTLVVALPQDAETRDRVRLEIARYDTPDVSAETLPPSTDLAYQLVDLH